MHQGGPLPAFNSHHFVSNMFWLLHGGSRACTPPPGDGGAEGHGFKCVEEGINKIMEVLRTERRERYGRAVNDVGGGAENEGEKRIEGVCVWGVAASVPSDGPGGGVWNNFVRYLRGPGGAGKSRRSVRLGRSDFLPLTLTHGGG